MIECTPEPLVPRSRYSFMSENNQWQPERQNRFTGFRHHAKVHSFRFVTVILAWLFIAAAFYERPEILTDLQRLIQHGMETIGDTIPSPWGPRIEFVFREIGGFIWLQITLIVVVIRVALVTIAGMWRLLRRKDRRMV